jgi:hypothetical protein
MTTQNEQIRAEQIDHLLYRAHQRMAEGNTGTGLRLLEGLLEGYKVSYILVKNELENYVANGLLPQDFLIPDNRESFLSFLKSLIV